MKKVVKDYLGFLMGNDVEVEEFEKEFLMLEKARENDVIPIEDLKIFDKYGKKSLQDLSDIDMSQKMIFEGLKANSITFKFYKEGDTYYSLNKKIFDNEKYRRAYNIIMSNVFDIYKESGATVSDVICK